MKGPSKKVKKDNAKEKLANKEVKLVGGNQEDDGNNGDDEGGPGKRSKQARKEAKLLRTKGDLEKQRKGKEQIQKFLANPTKTNNLPEAGTYSQQLALHCLTTNHVNTFCLYHHKNDKKGTMAEDLWEYYKNTGTPLPRCAGMKRTNGITQEFQDTCTVAALKMLCYLIFLSGKPCEKLTLRVTTRKA
ncbi:hypothetical protein SERLA73DRAFT_157415 [Serpula lacrymans var. lacrymans S7.3]|uniref:Uncharacterized protein n=1 Tax=Serpula lacrymans var. lacrymans (strain S7.3) TaxID=936435 RepID=F8QIW9_SERL3|nr:hypothetical protein SERLA73DRAFT_157415 [Serpula lacrymans var. lacrymans S7.3]